MFGTHHFCIAVNHQYRGRDPFYVFIPDVDEEVLYHREIAKVYKEDGTLTDAWIYWYNGDVNGRSRIVSGDALEFVSSKKKLIQ